MENLNKRHRAAQMAGRASIEFYVALAVKNKQGEVEGGKVKEEAYVIRAFKNGVVVFVSK
jgi:exosome complex exonuclease DIS3/RRP44